MREEQLVHETVPPQERVDLMEQYVTEGVHDPAVRDLAFQWAATNPLNPAQGILDEQGKRIKYVLDCDNGSCEIIRTARRIITDGYGDCKKKSIVTAAMLRIIGIPAIVVWLDQESTGSASNHVAVQACRLGEPRLGEPRHGAHTAVVVTTPRGGPDCGGGWIWLETTLPGARVGADPYEEFRRLGGARRHL